MNGWREKLARFMVGRYGADQFGKFLTGFAVVLFVINLFARWRLLEFLVVLCLLYCYFRIFSRNVPKRYEENQKYLSWRRKAEDKWKHFRFQAEQRRKYHIYRCPDCGQKIRIPRGKGKVSVHCPKCNRDFIKKS